MNFSTTFPEFEIKLVFIGTELVFGVNMKAVDNFFRVTPSCCHAWLFVVAHLTVWITAMLSKSFENLFFFESIRSVGFEGEMSVIFWVYPLFAFSFSGLIMASNSSRGGGAASEHFWIGTETLESVSLFSADGVARIPRCLIGKKEDWWWVKPQVHGSTKVVKRVSFRQGVMNSIKF